MSVNWVEVTLEASRTKGEVLLAEGEVELVVEVAFTGAERTREAATCGGSVSRTCCSRIRKERRDRRE